MRRAGLVRFLVVIPSLIGAAGGLSAQQPAGDPPGSVDACTYSACALNIAPRWNGLAVVRGSAGARVANLNFFWPRDVSPSLRGPAPLAVGADSAAAQGRTAVRLRRIGATLTDAGLLAAAFGTFGALRQRRVGQTDGLLMGVGGALLGASVPLQFAADGALSRAIWWHNRRYAR